MTLRPSVGQVTEEATWPAGLAEAALRECFLAFPEVRFTVTGHCMRPALQQGDQVVLVPAALRPPRVGDIVLAAQGDGLRLHRLVVGAGWLRRFARGWRTKADRSAVLDPPMAAGDVLGTLVSREGRPLRRRPFFATWSLAEALKARLRRRRAPR
jgi:hypothetical protein